MESAADLTIEHYVSSTSQKGAFEYRLLLKGEQIAFVRLLHTNLVLTLGSDAWRLVEILGLTQEELVALGKKDDIYSIDYIRVDDTLRRQGHATRLLEKVMKEHGDKEMCLYVEPTDVSYAVLVALYEKHGFKVWFEWENYMNDKRCYMYRNPAVLATK